MKVIIVGCGKVGKTLAEELNKEDNEVTRKLSVYVKDKAAKGGD